MLFKVYETTKAQTVLYSHVSSLRTRGRNEPLLKLLFYGHFFQFEYYDVLW